MRVAAERTLAPIAKFFNGMKKLSEGEHDYRINVDFNSELGILAHRFNDMADKLEKSLHERDRLLNTISAALNMKAEFDKKIKDSIHE